MHSHLTVAQAHQVCLAIERIHQYAEEIVQSHQQLSHKKLIAKQEKKTNKKSIPSAARYAI